MESLLNRCSVAFAAIVHLIRVQFRVEMVDESLDGNLAMDDNDDDDDTDERRLMNWLRDKPFAETRSNFFFRSFNCAHGIPLLFSSLNLLSVTLHNSAPINWHKCKWMKCALSAHGNWPLNSEVNQIAGNFQCFSFFSVCLQNWCCPPERQIDHYATMWGIQIPAREHLRKFIAAVSRSVPLQLI